MVVVTEVKVPLMVERLVPEILVEVSEVPFRLVKPRSEAKKLVEVALVRVVLPDRLEIPLM